MNKLKNIISKIELIHIAIILIIILTLLFLIYQYKSIMPHKISINENIEIEEVSSTDKVVEDINEKKKKIICTLETAKLPEKEYYNYVTGRGKGIEVDCSILLKMDEQYYKIKTLQEDGAEEGKIKLVGIVKNKYLKEEFEILLYDNQKQKIYQYTGGISEKDI